jgi:acetyl esterase
LAGLPPTHLAIGRLDPLLDDNERLAAELTAAGVACRLMSYDGLVHGFIRYGQFVASVRRAISDSAVALREALVEQIL